jgi:cephalosporin hydroxylase
MTDLTSLSPADLADLVRQANILYFRSGAWQTTTWLGVPCAQCPTDLWAYQELLHRVRPDVVIETGTWAGGTALFLATVLDQLGHGRLISIDRAADPDRPAHPRLSYLQGDSTDPATAAAVRADIGDATVLVLLDADHAADAVLAELRLWAPLVTPGSYLVVQDTGFDGWPAWPEHGPGPATAAEAFLAEDDRFEIDAAPSAHLLTLSPGGFLRRR